MLPILDTITEHLASFPEVERVVLYGSRARGDHRERSDIDLAVECSGDARWGSIWAYLEYDAPTLLDIDLARLNSAPDDLRERIERGGVTLYER